MVVQKILDFCLILGFLTICSGQDVYRWRKLANLAKSQELAEAQKFFKTIDIQEVLLEGFSNIGLNFSLPLSQECTQDLTPIVLYSMLKNESGVPEDFIEGPLIQMFDAIGKIPPGMFAGALVFWGYYPECKQISYNYPGRQRLWEAEYSRAYYNAKMEDGSDPNNCQDPTTMGAWDFCLPKGCNNDDVLFLLRNFFNISSSSISPFCIVDLIDDVPKKMDYQAWIVWIVIGTILGLGLLVSLVDYFLIKEDSTLRKDTSVKVFMSFSLYSNIREIFTVGSTKKSGQIGTLHCIRFFSICWVVQGHVLGIGSSFTNNVLDFIKIVKDLPTQFVANAFFSVDNFFFISGLLLSFLWFKEYKKNKKAVMSPQAWGLFYLHRIVRLSPPYYLALVFFIFIFPTLLHNMPIMISPSPLYRQLDPCTTNFWANLLYLNNYVHWKDECFGVSWYLATDMQMFFFTPLLLIPLALNKFAGLAIAGAMFIASTAANIITIYKYHYGPTYPVVGWVDPEEKHPEQYQLWIYASPYIRCQVYIMGLLVGYFMQMTPKLKINKIVNLALWALSASIMLFVVLCLYRYYNNHELSLFGRAMYSAFSKPLWATGLSWIVISCYYGYGGPINQFMSWNIWIPLSRLSYCVYLLHFIVIYILMGLTQAPLIFSGFVDMWVKLVLPIIVISFLVAVIWSAAFEIPFSKAEMVLLRPKQHTVSKINHGETKRPQEAWDAEEQIISKSNEKF